MVYRLQMVVESNQIGCISSVYNAMNTNGEGTLFLITLTNNPSILLWYQLSRAQQDPKNLIVINLPIFFDCRFVFPMHMVSSLEKVKADFDASEGSITVVPLKW